MPSEMFLAHAAEFIGDTVAGWLCVGFLIGFLVQREDPSQSAIMWIGLIIVSVVFGIGTVAIKEQEEPFLLFFKSATEIIHNILNVLIRTTPVGVASLIAETILTTADVDATFRKLGLYFLTVELGLVGWGFITTPLVFFVVHHANPFRFYGTIMPSIMIVIVTTETFHSLENKNGCDPRITRLVAPLAAAIVRAGSAFYVACSCKRKVEILMKLIVTTKNLVLT